MLSTSPQRRVLGTAHRRAELCIETWFLTCLLHLAEPSTLMPAPRTEPGASESLLNHKGCALFSLFTGHLLNSNAFVHFKDLPYGREM